MHSLRPFHLTIVAALFTLGVHFASAQESQTPVIGADVRFRPITDEDVRQAHQSVLRAREEFRRAATDPKIISGWETHLGLSAWCDANLAGEAPVDDLAALTSLLGQGTPGFEWPPLQSLRQSLLTFADRWRDRYDAKLEEKVEERLALVKVCLASPTLTSQQQSELATAAHWLARHGQSPELLVSLGQRYRGSNLRMSIGKHLISSYMREPINRPEVVSDEILGTTISGTGQAVGFADVELIPSSNTIAFEIVATMCVRTNTVASKGPVRVYSNGATHIESRKPIYFDGKQLTTSQARSTASTDSVTTGISTNFKRLANRLVTRIAEKEIDKKKDEGNATAASHAERDASAETDLDVAKIIEETNAEFKNEVEIPLARRGFSLRHLLCSTTSSAFHIQLGAAGAGQLLAPPPPGELPSSSDVQFQLHPTAVNNATATYLAGDEYWLSELVKQNTIPNNETDGSPKDRSKDVGFVLDSLSPITASFDDGEIRIVVRAERILVQGQDVAPMNITLHFRPQITANSAELFSSREPEAMPPGKTKGLSGPEVALRRVLINRLKKELENKPVPLQPFPIKRDGRMVGNLVVESLKANAGWLEGGLKLIPTSAESGQVER